MYVLGIDVGTTGTKALLINVNGNVAASGYQGYELITGKGGVVEQDANEWWKAVVFATRQAIKDVTDKSQIVALSLSTQGASSLLVDENNVPLGNSLTWMDSRAVEEKEEFAAFFKDDSIYKKTGWPLNVSLDSVKLLWHKRHNQQAMKKAKKYVSTIEFINTKLTGECVADPTNAAIRQLMNLSSSEWDKDILDFLGVDESLMPKLKETGSVIGKLSVMAAEELGLSQSLTIFGGAHDQYSAALGVGAIAPGDMVLSTGTAWVTLGITQTPMFTKSFIAPARHVVGGLWGALTSIPVAGAALDWFKRITDESYDNINKHAAQRMEKAKDLFFYPYFIGARFPVWNENVRAVFAGLGLEHDRYDMFRAVMEGVAFQVKLTIDDYAKNGANIDTLHMAGGATKSDLWMSMIGAVTGAKIYKSEQPDAACIGAAMIAAVGCGIVSDYRQAKELFVKSQCVDAVDESMRNFYIDKYIRYMEAWNKISKIYV